MRKKKHAEHVNHERWLVSYADFITLLFAFFVVMFAVSQVDTKKLGRFTESFSKSVGLQVLPTNGVGVLPGTDTVVASTEELAGKEHETNIAPALNELDGLKSALAELTEAHGEIKGLEVIRRRADLVLRLPAGVLFDSGDDGVKEPAAKVLRAIAPELRQRNVDIRVEGHTDNRPIMTDRFRSNWDLSTARATAVVAILAKEGFPEAHLSAAGCGEFRPVATNDSDEGRRKNRRVDVVVSVAIPEEKP